MDYEWIEGLRRLLTQLADRIGNFLPDLLTAAGLIVAGWILARLLGALGARLLSRARWLVESPAVQAGLRRVGVERPISDVIGTLVFWVIFVFFLTAATEALGLPVLATWLSGVSHYLPRVLVAVLIVLVGLAASTVARDAITAAAAAAGVVYGRVLGRLVQLIILLIAAVTGIDQIGIDSKFFTATITIVIGAITGGTALGFGLGARTAVSNIIASHYLRQTYQVGHTVRVGAVQGRIVQITTTAVILDSPEGRVLVPAKEFSEAASVLVTAGG
jgi:hypothetical protein